MAKIAMKRGKKHNPLKDGKAKAPRKDPRIAEVYEQEITFTCPIRGKVTQKVKVKRYKTLTETGAIKPVLNSKESIDQLDQKDDGLSIYSDGEELGLSDKEDIE